MTLVRMVYMQFEWYFDHNIMINNVFVISKKNYIIIRLYD